MFGKRITPWAIALLLTLGLSSILLSLRRLAEPSLSPAERQEVLAASLLFGVAPTVGANVLWRQMRNRQRRDRQQHLHTLFFETLQQGQGMITVLDFAMRSHLSGQEATAYLNDRAQEFNATFEVDAAGGILYCFPLRSLPSTTALDTTPSYDVVITAVPPDCRDAVILAIQHLTGQSRSTAATLLRQLGPQTPLPIQRQVSQAIAQDSRDRLQQAGATVMITLR